MNKLFKLIAALATFTVFFGAAVNYLIGRTKTEYITIDDNEPDYFC